MRILADTPKKNPDRPDDDPIPTKNPNPPQPVTDPGNPSQYPTQPNEVPANEPREVPDDGQNLSALRAFQTVFL